MRVWRHILTDALGLVELQDAINFLLTPSFPFFSRAVPLTTYLPLVFANLATQETITTTCGTTNTDRH
jgi:hypothetical protein